MPHLSFERGTPATFSYERGTPVTQQWYLAHKKHPPRRLAAMSPSYQEEDRVMPHRARGEVDEWAALQIVNRYSLLLPSLELSDTTIYEP